MHRVSVSANATRRSETKKTQNANKKRLRTEKGLSDSMHERLTPLRSYEGKCWQLNVATPSTRALSNRNCILYYKRIKAFRYFLTKSMSNPRLDPCYGIENCIWIYLIFLTLLSPVRLLNLHAVETDWMLTFLTVAARAESSTVLLNDLYLFQLVCLNFDELLINILKSLLLYF